MTKLLFVILALGCGGAERSLINLLNILPKDQFDVSLLLFRKEGEFLSQVPEHVHLLEIPDDLKRLYGPLKKSGRYVPVKLFGTLAGRLKEGKASEGKMMFRWRHFYKKALHDLPGEYDTAVSYLEGEPAYYIMDFVHAKRKIAWIHNDYLSLGHNPEDERPYFEKMDALVTISEKCLEILKKTFPELSGKMLLLENMTSAQAVRKQAAMSVPPEISKDCFRIVSVGRLVEAKGFDIAINAAAILKQKGLCFQWLILGEGVLREALEKQARSCGTDDCVKMIGLRSNPYIYLQNSDLLVQSSRFEGKSIVLDEAKMIGLPALLTRYPTSGDQIKDGINGWITDLNAEALAAKILDLSEHREELERVHAELLRNNYDNISELPKYIKLFTEKK